MNISPDTGDGREMSVEHRMGWLEGLVKSLDDRMTRREAEDAAWRLDVKSSIDKQGQMLSEINLKLSQSIGVFSVVKWAIGIGIVSAIPAVGWLLVHPWPFGR